MGTITARRRNDGGTAYLARIRIKSKGRIIHEESKTLETHKRAKDWIRDRETELSRPGEIERSKNTSPTLGDAIKRYLDEMAKAIGDTKEGTLNTIMGLPIARKKCHEIKSSDIVQLAKDLLSEDRKPQTVSGYLSNLASVFVVAKPAWEYELDHAQMKGAQAIAKNLGLIGNSDERERRPSLEELDQIMGYFVMRIRHIPNMVPMQKITPFAIFSTRRQDEIVSMAWKDFDEAGKRVLIRDMKHPGEKIGNDVWCDLPDQAIAIINSMPRVAPQIFPFKANTVSAAFTRACRFLMIDDLHFHDLRHDGISRLFEMKWNIPHVAAVSGHRSWSSLKRYTQLRQSGDKFENWKWLEIVSQPPKD